MWSSGDIVLLRYVVKGRVRWALPHLVVDDHRDVVALYAPIGARGARPRGARAAYIDQLVSGEWEHEPHLWHSNHALRLMRPGRAHALVLHWREDWAFRGWYVNLEDPFRRSPLGFETRDHALDLWITPDGNAQWKDEDHLAELVSRGVWSPGEAAAIHGEGERVLAERPWPTGWEHWRPDPSWPVPSLPLGWDLL